MCAPRRYVVMLGFAGARIALTLAELHREEVQERFPKHFLKQEENLRKVINDLSGLTISRILQEQGLPEECLVALQKNEVFPALWKLAEGLDAGLDVELHKIPVLQFVIEVSELFDANPYVNMTALENKKCFLEMYSVSQEIAETKILETCDTVDSEVATIYSLLIATDEPERLLTFAETNGLPSAIIGRLTDKNDRVVRNGEIIRYLTPEG